MTWIAAALASTALFAMVTVLDKKLVVSYFPSATLFNLFFGLLQFGVAAFFFAAVVPFTGFDTAGIPWAFTSGLAWALGLFLFFHGLRLEEVSRATPIQMTSPVFASLLAVAFLGETLSWSQWCAVFVVVIGAALVTARPSGRAIGIAHGRALFILLGASLVLGVAYVLNKEATNNANVWTVQALRALGMGTGMVFMTARPPVVRQIPTVLRNIRAMRLFLLTEALLAPAASLLFVIGLSLGPVSLVSAATSSRPLFVLILSIALSTSFWNVLQEPLDRATLGLKVFSTALIVAGVTAMALL